MASVFKRNGRGNYLILYFDHRGRRRKVSSHTTDKKTAMRIAAKLKADEALRRHGVVDVWKEELARANLMPLERHMEDYLAYCRVGDQAPRAVFQKESHLRKVFQEAGAFRLLDLTMDAVQKNLQELRTSGKSARTVNFRRQIVLAFVNWCVRQGRLEVNRLRGLPVLDEHQDRRRIRRALTEAELSRLLAGAEARGRRLWYLTAALAGLRKSELACLTWGDIDLDRQVLTIAGGKAKRIDQVPLHPQLAEAFARERPGNAAPQDRVFSTVVTDRTRVRDFERAGIPLVDEHGRVADLHSLRTTLATQLARQGVAPQIGRLILRHADYRTTLRHYTVLGLEDASKALQRVPQIEGLGEEPA